MSGPHTVEPPGRTKPCAPGCRHPVCAALARETRAERAERCVAQLRSALDPSWTYTLECLDELARLARDGGG